MKMIDTQTILKPTKVLRKTVVRSTMCTSQQPQSHSRWLDINRSAPRRSLEKNHRQVRETWRWATRKPWPLTIRKSVALVATLLLPLSLGLTACGGGPREDMGTVVGAVAGGAIGNQFGKGEGRAAATIAGILIGGIVGSDIGRELDESDRRRAARAEYAALENGRSGVAREWRNPDNGHYGRIVPQRPYRVGGRDCRNYTHTIYIDGQPETMRGRACRNRDGSWSRAG